MGYGMLHDMAGIVLSERYTREWVVIIDGFSVLTVKSVIKIVQTPPSHLARTLRRCVKLNL